MSALLVTMRTKPDSGSCPDSIFGTGCSTKGTPARFKYQPISSYPGWPQWGLEPRCGFSHLRACWFSECFDRQVADERLEFSRHRRVGPVLHLDPVFRAAGAIAPIAAFRDQTLEAHAAGGGEQVRADRGRLERRDEYAVRPAAQQPRQIGLAHRQWQLAQVLAAKRKDVERIELNLVIMLARVQGVEVRGAVDAEHHGLAVDDELLLAVLQRGLDDPGVSLGPVVAVAGEEPHGFLALDVQAIAVKLDFVNPIARRMARGRLDTERFRLFPLEGHGYTRRRLNCCRSCGE